MLHINISGPGPGLPPNVKQVGSDTENLQACREEWAELCAAMGHPGEHIDPGEMFKMVRALRATPDAEALQRRSDKIVEAIGNLNAANGALTKVAAAFTELGQEMQRINSNLWDLYEGK